MKSFRSLALVAAVTAVVAVPATASATPKVKEVRAAVSKANGSLDSASKAALSGNYGQLRSAIARLGNYTRRADQLASTIAKLAESRSGRVHASKALISVAGQYDKVVGGFATILDEVLPKIQPLIAEGLALSIDAQERIVSMLAKLAEQLPVPAAQAVLDAIERYEADGDIAALVQALSSDEVSAGVKGALTEHLDAMFVHLEGLVDRLAEVDPELAGMVGGVIDSLHETIDQVNNLIAGLFDGLLGGAIPLFPGFDDLPGFGELFGSLPGFFGGNDVEDDA